MPSSAPPRLLSWSSQQKINRWKWEDFCNFFHHSSSSFCPFVCLIIHWRQSQKLFTHKIPRTNTLTRKGLKWEDKTRANNFLVIERLNTNYHESFYRHLSLVADVSQCSKISISIPWSEHETWKKLRKIFTAVVDTRKINKSLVNIIKQASQQCKKCSIFAVNFI